MEKMFSKGRGKASVLKSEVFWEFAWKVITKTLTFLKWETFFFQRLKFQFRLLSLFTENRWRNVESSFAEKVFMIKYIPTIILDLLKRTEEIMIILSFWIQLKFIRC